MSVTVGQILYDSTYIGFSEQSKAETGRMVGARGRGQGSGELLFNEHGASVGEDKNSGGGWW